MRSKMVSRRDNLGERKRLGKSAKMMHLLSYIIYIYISLSIPLHFGEGCYCTMEHIWVIQSFQDGAWTSLLAIAGKSRDPALPIDMATKRNLWEWCLGANTATILHNILSYVPWYHVDNLLSSMSNKHFRKFHDNQLSRWAIKLPDYNRREAAKQTQDPGSWITLRLQGLTFIIIIPKFRDETLNLWRCQNPDCRESLLALIKMWYGIIDPTKCEALTMPSSNPWLRPAGRLANMTPLKVIPNGYLCGLLKLHLYLSSLVHQSVNTDLGRPKLLGTPHN